MATDVSLETSDRVLEKPEPEVSANATVAEDEEDNGITEIESLCMNCHENVSNQISRISRS